MYGMKIDLIVWFSFVYTESNFSQQTRDSHVFIKKLINLFSRGHATLHLAVSVGQYVRTSVGHIFEFQAVFALQLLSNRPRLDCRVSGLVFSCGHATL